MQMENKKHYSGHVPVVINNRDRLTTTRNLVTDLLERGYTDILIIDNGSTYEPLLDWYRVIAEYVSISYQDNLGHTALWKSGIIKEYSKYPYIAYTDSDIELNRNTPKDFIHTLVDCMVYHNVDKAGLAIHYKDLPQVPVSSKHIAIEERYWKKKITSINNLEVYSAPIDTTFAVIRTGMPYSWNLRAVRVAGDYTCRHIPWYITPEDESEEDKYYLEHADPKYCTLKTLIK